MPYDPIPALRCLVAREVRFVVIGGVAGGLLGSPQLTRDLDICYERSTGNLRKLAEALRAIHATLRGAPEDVSFLLDERTLSRGDAFTFKTDLGPLDIFARPSGSDGFDALDRNATTMDVGGASVRVASLDDLIRMKRAAGRPRDLSTLEILGGLRDELEGRPDEPYHPPGDAE